MENPRYRFYLSSLVLYLTGVHRFGYVDRVVFVHRGLDSFDEENIFRNDHFVRKMDCNIGDALFYLTFGRRTSAG